MNVLVTADFREPLQKGGEGVGGDRDEPTVANIEKYNLMDEATDAVNGTSFTRSPYPFTWGIQACSSIG